MAAQLHPRQQASATDHIAVHVTAKGALRLSLPDARSALPDDARRLLSGAARESLFFCRQAGGACFVLWLLTYLCRRFTPNISDLCATALSGVGIAPGLPLELVFCFTAVLCGIAVMIDVPRAAYRLPQQGAPPQQAQPVSRDTADAVLATYSARLPHYHPVGSLPISQGYASLRALAAAVRTYPDATYVTNWPAGRYGAGQMPSWLTSFSTLPLERSPSGYDPWVTQRWHLAHAVAIQAGEKLLLLIACRLVWQSALEPVAWAGVTAVTAWVMRMWAGLWAWLWVAAAAPAAAGNATAVAATGGLLSYLSSFLSLPSLPALPTMSSMSSLSLLAVLRWLAYLPLWLALEVLALPWRALGLCGGVWGIVAGYYRAIPALTASVHAYLTRPHTTPQGLLPMRNILTVLPVLCSEQLHKAGGYIVSDLLKPYAQRGPACVGMSRRQAWRHAVLSLAYQAFLTWAAIPVSGMLVLAVAEAVLRLVLPLYPPFVTVVGPLASVLDLDAGQDPPLSIDWQGSTVAVGRSRAEWARIAATALTRGSFDRATACSICWGELGQDAGMGTLNAQQALDVDRGRRYGYGTALVRYCVAGRACSASTLALTSCGHAYHARCLVHAEVSHLQAALNPWAPRWPQLQCPTCRAPYATVAVRFDPEEVPEAAAWAVAPATTPAGGTPPAAASGAAAAAKATGVRRRAGSRGAQRAA